MRDEIVRIVRKYCDCFCKRGAKCTILDYEFTVDTGAAKPICCKTPSYGHYKSNNIMTQVEQLLDNDWITECKQGSWGSMIVLAPKPHQEKVVDIQDFVWRMCVSYRGLNKVTKPFEYLIPRCDNAISSLDGGSGIIWIICLDARQGYHQIFVRMMDREKLAFLAPNNVKCTFKVMPFGPKNAPAFYSCMMGHFKEEWNKLFIEELRSQTFIGSEPIRVTFSNDIFLGDRKLVSGTKTIIDDVILWCGNIECIFIYLECICCVFLKYCFSFSLNKCSFIKPRVEYVGHDITSDGNCPAQSKFNFINDWKLPTSGQSLFSFIGLVNFYHQYAPYFKICLQPLRKLNMKFYRKPIPVEEWTSELRAIFQELKENIVSSPVMARFNPDRLTFLKTDWSAEGMGWILMQPADDK